MVDIDGSTDVPVDSIDRLSNIVNKGVGYTEAYATVLLVKNNNPDRSIEEITKKAKDIKPHLCKEIDDVSSHLQIELV